MNIASIVLVGLVAGLAQFSHAGKIFQSFSRFCFINYRKNSFEKNTAVYLSTPQVQHEILHGYFFIHKIKF
jgi:hypothetical protein